MTVNERIVQLLKENSAFTQKELANTISVSPSTMNNWLKLGRSIPAEMIIPISEFLGVSCEFLLTGVQKEVYLNNEDSDWLALIHKLPIERRYELKGYVKRMLDEELLAGIPETAEDAAKLDVNYDYSHNLPSADEVRKHGVSDTTNSNVG